LSATEQKPFSPAALAAAREAFTGPHVKPAPWIWWYGAWFEFVNGDYVERPDGP
jgi:hypothetical protein